MPDRFCGGMRKPGLVAIDNRYKPGLVAVDVEGLPYVGVLYYIAAACRLPCLIGGRCGVGSHNIFIQKFCRNLCVCVIIPSPAGGGGALVLCWWCSFAQAVLVVVQQLRAGYSVVVVVLLLFWWWWWWWWYGDEIEISTVSHKSDSLSRSSEIPEMRRLSPDDQNLSID